MKKAELSEPSATKRPNELRGLWNTVDYDEAGAIGRVTAAKDRDRYPVHHYHELCYLEDQAVTIRDATPGLRSVALDQVESYLATHWQAKTHNMVGG